MLTAKEAMIYFPESDETQKGHMWQNKQRLQSTKKIEDEQEMRMVFCNKFRHKKSVSISKT